MSEWKPIESAPVCENILVYLSYDVPGEDHDVIEELWVDYLFPEGDWFHWPLRLDIPFPPTHWAPLPEPPEGE